MKSTGSHLTLSRQGQGLAGLTEATHFSAKRNALSEMVWSPPPFLTFVSAACLEYLERFYLLCFVS